MKQTKYQRIRSDAQRSFRTPNLTRIKRRYTKLLRGIHCHVLLKVGCQSFFMTRDTLLTKAEAQWFQNQLAHALAELIRLENLT